MVRGKKKEKERILGAGEKADIASQRQEAEATLKQLDNYGKGTQASGINKSKLQAEIAHYDQVLKDGSAPSVRSGTKDALAREAKELQGQLKDGMPSRHEMDHPARHPGAVHKHLNWVGRNKENIKRYKEIQKTLEPQDPTAVDLERLRREK